MLLREPWSCLSVKPHVRASQDSLEFWIPVTWFQSLSVELGFWIPILSRIPSCIPDSNVQDSGFHKQNFPAFPISQEKNLTDSFTWSDLSCDKYFVIIFCWYFLLIFYITATPPRWNRVKFKPKTRKSTRKAWVIFTLISLAFKDSRCPGSHANNIIVEPL